MMEQKEELQVLSEGESGQPPASGGRRGQLRVPAPQLQPLPGLRRARLAVRGQSRESFQGRVRDPWPAPCG